MDIHETPELSFDLSARTISFLVAAVRSCPDTLFILDEHMRILAYSDNVREVLLPEISQGEIAGRDIRDLLSQLKPADRYDQYRAVIRTGAPFSDELDLPGSLGGTRSMSVKAFKVGPGLAILARDVSRYVEESRSKDETEFRLQAVLRNSPNIVMIVDRDGTIRFINRAAEGFTCEGTLGKTIYEFIPGEHQAAARRATEHVFNTGEEGEYETSGPGMDGGTSWYHTEVGAIEKNGRILGTTHVAMDITARKTAEDALAESERNYREIFNAALDGILIADMEGRQFVAANDAICRMLGYTTGEIMKLGVADIHPKESLPKVIEVFEKRGAGINPIAADIPVRRKDGSVFYADIGSTPMKLKGRLCLLGVFRDTTEKKAGEKALQDKEAQLWQIQRLDSIGRLAGGVAHDFNNVLGVIMGYCDMLLSSSMERAPSSKMILSIKSAAQRAADLTRQLLAFSRRQVLKLQEMDLGHAVRETEELLRTMLGAHINLVIHCPCDLGWVKADPSQVGQIIINLAANARDAMPGGGILAIELANADLDDEYASRHVGVNPGPYVMLSIADNGAGMDEHTRTHLFEPFFTTKEDGKGTGLGLSIVYGVVKQSGGNIWVYSEPGKGTIFKVYLPRIDAPGKPGQEPLLENGAKRATTVLLVEDESELREIVTGMLSEEGCIVLAASNGEEAIRMSRDHEGEIDLLLTDVVMPGMNGRTLTEKMNEIRPGTKTLFMSGYTDDTVIGMGISDTTMHFIQKPFTMDELLRKIRQVVN